MHFCSPKSPQHPSGKSRQTPPRADVALDWNPRPEYQDWKAKSRIWLFSGYIETNQSKYNLFMFISTINFIYKKIKRKHWYIFCSNLIYWPHSWYFNKQQGKSRRSAAPFVGLICKADHIQYCALICSHNCMQVRLWCTEKGGSNHDIIQCEPSSWLSLFNPRHLSTWRDDPFMSAVKMTIKKLHFVIFLYFCSTFIFNY